MKLAFFIPAFATANNGNGGGNQHVDGANVHLNGCIWPEQGAHPQGLHTIADDEFARFVGLTKGVGLDNPYSEAEIVTRQCPTHCVYDGSDYSCSGYEDDEEYTCHFKVGKGNRPPGKHYIWTRSTNIEGIAVFFKSDALEQYRKISKKKKCPVPVITASDPDAICGDRPQIPTKKQWEDEGLRFDAYTVWNDDGTSVQCGPGATPVRGGAKFEALNLVCTKGKGNGFKWMHQSASGKVQPAGNKWLHKKFLCKKCHNKCDGGDGGDGGEGSGAESPDVASVSL